MELWDDGNSGVVTAVFELPGMGPDEVSVDVVDGRLIVSGERRQRALSKASTAHGHTGARSEDEDASPLVGRSGILQVRELKYGFFRRVLSVPTGCKVSFSLSCCRCELELTLSVTLSDRGPGCVHGAWDAHRVMASCSEGRRPCAQR